MSNKYLSQEIYNEEFKNGFLELYKSNTGKSVEGKQTANVYRYIFQRTYNTEIQLEKDIYDFNDAELNSLLHSFNNGSVFTVGSNISILKQYLDYCVGKGYIRVNLLQDVSGHADMLKFVDKNTNENKYISRENFETMIAGCVNAQDMYPLAMLYYGFRGEDCYEITNLKTEHVDKDAKTIYIESRNKTIEIDDFLMNIICAAIKEDEYQKMLTVVPSKAISTDFQIFANDYVMRVANKDENIPVLSFNVGARLRRIKQFLGKGYSYLTVTSIWYSGMLDKARQVYKQNGEVTKEDWIKICEEYNIAEMYWSRNKQRFDGLLEEKKEDKKENI